MSKSARTLRAIANTNNLHEKDAGALHRIAEEIAQKYQPKRPIERDTQIAELEAKNERLRKKLQAIRNWTDLSDGTIPIQALTEIEQLCNEAAEAAEALQVLGKASYTPSRKAREMMKKNCEGCQRSGESKIPFREAAEGARCH